MLVSSQLNQLNAVKTEQVAQLTYRDHLMGLIT